MTTPKFPPRLWITAWQHYQITGFSTSESKPEYPEREATNYLSLAEHEHLLKEAVRKAKVEVMLIANNNCLYECKTPQIAAAKVQSEKLKSQGATGGEE